MLSGNMTVVKMEHIKEYKVILLSFPIQYSICLSLQLKYRMLLEGLNSYSIKQVVYQPHVRIDNLPPAVITIGKGEIVFNRSVFKLSNALYLETQPCNPYSRHDKRLMLSVKLVIHVYNWFTTSRFMESFFTTCTGARSKAFEDQKRPHYE